MKSTASLLEHHGGTDAHAIWVEFFTASCKISADQKNKTPVDHFLIAFNYQPTPTRAIRKEIEKCNNRMELEESLAKLFGFDTFPLVNLLVLAKTVNDRNERFMKTQHQKLLIESIFRGLIVLGYRLKGYVDAFLEGRHVAAFPVEYWELVHFPLLFLLKSGDAYFKKLVRILNPFFNAFSDLEKILDLEQNSPLRTSFYMILSTILPFFHLEIEQGTTNFLDFLMAGFQSIGRRQRDSQRDPELIGIWHGFLQLIHPMAANMEQVKVGNLMHTSSIFLEQIEHFSAIFEPKYFTFCIDSITLLEHVKEMNSVLAFSVVSGILAGVRWLLASFSVVDEKDKMVAIEPKDSKLEWSDWDSYFVWNTLLPDPHTVKLESPYLSEYVSVIRNVMVQSPEIVVPIIEGYTRFLSKNQAIDRISFGVILVSTLMSVPVQINHALQAFLYCILQISFYQYEWSPVLEKMRRLCLCFLFSLSCQSSELLSFVLETLSPLLCKQQGLLRMILPAFRSCLLIDAQINFVHYFMQSGIIEELVYHLRLSNDIRSRNELAAFCQMLVIARPLEVFSSFTFVPVLRDLVMQKELRDMLAPCFKIGFSLSYTAPLAQGRKAAINAIEQLQVLLKVADNNIQDLGLMILRYFIDAIHYFDTTVLTYLVNMRFPAEIAALPKMMKTVESVVVCIDTLSALCKVSSDILTELNADNSDSLKQLEEAIKEIEATEEVIDSMIRFMLDGKGNTMIVNRAGLALLLKCSEGTRYDVKVLTLLVELCRGNIANSFECFSCNIIRFLMNIRSEKSFIENGIPLFKMIGSTFFSPLTINETAKAMRLSENRLRTGKHRALLDCFSSLLLEDRDLPVSGFFHFNGPNTGICGPLVEPALFTQGFSIVTAFREEGDGKAVSPIISLYQNTDNCFTVFMKAGVLYIMQRCQGRLVISNLSFKTRLGRWYKLVLIFQQNVLTCYLNDQQFDPINISKLEFGGRVNIMLGVNENDRFVGDIGPTLFFRLTQIEKIRVRYTQFNTTRSDLKSAFIKYLPWSVKLNKIRDVVREDDAVELRGSVIPFCSTISDVVQYAGSFQVFLPLILYMNHDEETTRGSDIHTNESFFYTWWQILVNLIVMSEEMQNIFEGIGGFQLLAGFLSQLKIDNFTPIIHTCLEDVFDVLKIPSMRKYMVEFIWLNFDLWSKMSYEFQMRMYSKTLYSVWSKDKKAGCQSFAFSSLDFLVYMIQDPLSNATNVDPTVTFFPNTNAPSVANTPAVITEEGERAIKEAQWRFFTNLLAENSSPSIFVSIFMIAYGHKNVHTRQMAMNLIEKCIEDNNPDVISSIYSVVNNYGFLKMVSDISPVPIIKSALRIAYLLKCREKNGGYEAKSGILLSNMCVGIHVRLMQLEIDADTANELAVACFGYSIGKDHYVLQKPFCPVEFVYPEFLLVVFALLPLMDRESCLPLLKDIELSLLAFTSTTLALMSDPCWPLIILKFALFTYSMSKNKDLCANFISIFAFELCRNNRMAEVVDLFSLYVAIGGLCQWDVSDLLTMCLIRVSTSANSTAGNEDAKKFISGFGSRFLMFPVRYKEVSKSIFDVDPTEIDELFDAITNLTDEDKVALEDTFEILYEKRMSADGKWLDLKLAIELFILLNTMYSPDTEVVCEISPSFVMPIHMLYANILAMILTDSDAKDTHESVMNIHKNLPHGKNYDITQHELQLALESGRKDGFESTAVQMEHAFKHVFSDALMNMSKALIQHSVMSKFDPKYKDSLQSWQKGYAQSRHLLALHNHKLMTSFLREVTSNRGPWTSTTTETKWRCCTKVDGLGRNIFMSVNRNFDDHKKASALRDSTEYEDNSEPKMKEITFKRVLERRSSVHPSAVTSYKNEISFRAVCHSLARQVTGVLHMTDAAIAFDGNESINTCGTPIRAEGDQNMKYWEVAFENIEFVFTRRVLHADIGCEIFTNTRKTYLVTFTSHEKRGECLSLIKKHSEKIHRKPSKLFRPFHKACGGRVQTMSSSDLVARSKIVSEWQHGRISNFQYLFYLNILGGRSFNDLSQYPVYPWVLSDYTSDHLDLDDPKVYRDLSKPIGALNPDRLAHCERLEKEMEDEEQKCFYRTHYSNPAAVIGYLIRMEPFSTLHILLQEGKYDHPDRLFFSIPKAWAFVTSKNMDFRELTPEFFFSHHFLTNENGFDLGVSKGRDVSDVELPMWAKTPREFISLHRRALESDYVSMHLSEWIDITFGVHQHSREHKTLFHMFTYPDYVQSNGIEISDITLVRHHAANFGQCPIRLFSAVHPKRSVSIHKSPSIKEFPLIEGTIVASSRRYMLTSRSFLINCTTRAVQSTAFKWKQYSKCILSKRYIFAAGHDGTCVNVFDLKANKEIGVLPHTTAMILSMAKTGTLLMTGGSDCAVYVWDVTTLSLIGKILTHSLPITALCGSNLLDLIVSIDEGHNVCYSTLSDNRVVHVFSIDCDKKATHMVKILASGVVAISSVLGSQDTRVDFYDLCGICISTVSIPRAIEAMEVITTRNFSEFLAVTTITKQTMIVDCGNFEIVNTIKKPMDPRFVCQVSDRLLAGVKSQHEETRIIMVEF